jgi:hypothetical protein
LTSYHKVGKIQDDMLSTPHLLVGAAIAKTIPNPAISLPVAFASHFLLDATPHWDGSPKAPYSRKVIIAATSDYVFGAGLIFLLTRNDPSQVIVLAGAFMATLPDFIMAASRHFSPRFNELPILGIFNRYHSHIQFNVRLSRGILSASAVIIAALVFLV